MAETIEPRRGIFNITTYDKDRYSQSFFSFLFFLNIILFQFIYIYINYTLVVFFWKVQLGLCIVERERLMQEY